MVIRCSKSQLRKKRIDGMITPICKPCMLGSREITAKSSSKKHETSQDTSEQPRGVSCHILHGLAHIHHH